MLRPSRIQPAMRRAYRALRLLALLATVITTGRVAADDVPSELVFGPKVYTRSSGAPVIVTDTFTVPAGVSAAFRLHIENGVPAVSGAQQVSSATVVLNGVEVIGGSDFHGNIAPNQKAVRLRSGPNTIAVRLTSSPGSAFRLRILGTLAPTLPVSLEPHPLTVSAGATDNLIATLSPPPRIAGTLITTNSNGRIASVPRRVAFAAGQTRVLIPVRGIVRGRVTVKVGLENGIDRNDDSYRSNDRNKDEEDDDRDSANARATVNVTDAAPPTLAGLLPSTLILTQGTSGTLTITLIRALAADTMVVLASDAPGVARVPANITIPAGQLRATVPVDGMGQGKSNVRAILNGQTLSSQITVNQALPTVVSLLPVNANVIVGASTSITLMLSAPQTTDTIVPISVASPGLVTAPAQVIVPAGQTTTIVTVNGTALGQVGITASLNKSSASMLLTVIAPPVAVLSVQPSRFTMNVGGVSTFTVTINATQTSNTVVGLAVSNPAELRVPATVTIAQGQLSAAFTATAFASGNAVITASVSGTSQSANIHIAPPAPAVVSLLPNPLVLLQGDRGSVTVTLNVAQEEATTVMLTSGDPSIAQVPPSISVPAGQLAVVVPVQALTPGTVSVTAAAMSNNNTTAASISVQVTAAGLPPDPGEAGKATLAGIDVNGNGVRDDVERYIALTYPNSARLRAALSSFAVGMQAAVLTAGRVDNATVATEKLRKALDCLWYLHGSASIPVWQMLRAEYLDTLDRSRAYLDYNRLMSGVAFTHTREDQRKAQCEFNPDTLPD